MYKGALMKPENKAIPFKNLIQYYLNKSNRYKASKLKDISTPESHLEVIRNISDCTMSYEDFKDFSDIILQVKIPSPEEEPYTMESLTLWSKLKEPILNSSKYPVGDITFIELLSSYFAYVTEEEAKQGNNKQSSIFSNLQELAKKDTVVALGIAMGETLAEW